MRKDIFKLVPEGALVTRKWLKSNGLTDHAINNLVRSPQLDYVKNGIYKRSGFLTGWEILSIFYKKHI